jgi:PKD repeat protein
VSFTGTGTDPDGHLPLTFLWNFGGGAPNRTVEDPGPVTFSTPGTYTVTFTVTDNLGLADPTPDSRMITVNPNQPPNGTIDSPATNVTITAGQSVSFTGTGTDPDGHLPLTFLWNFGGGAPNRTVEDPGLVTFSTPGTFTVTFTVTDSLGVADPTADSRMITVNAAPAPNLVGNPSFETDTSGWAAYGSSSTTIQRVAGGQDGAFALEVRGPASTSDFGINDRPDWVAATPAAGTRYRFTAWVRSAAHTGQARLRIREYKSGTQIGPTLRSAPVTLSPTWQMLTIDLVAGAAGSNLDVQVLDYTPATTGEIFQVDTISIRIVP